MVTCYNSWFRHSSYNSFQRQLNIYGFRRFPEGPDKDAYYHQDFVRGQYDRTFRILRNAVKGTNVRQPSDHTTFPDFYNPPIQDDDSVEIPIPNSDRVTTAASNRFPVETSNSPRTSMQNAFHFPTNELAANSNVFLYLALNHRSNAVGRNQSAYGLPVNPAIHTINELLFNTNQWAAPPVRSDQGLATTINPLMLELLALQGRQVNPSRPSSLLEQVLDGQARLDSLQRHNDDYPVPPFAPPRMMSMNIPPFNGHPSMPPVSDSNEEVLTLVLDRLQQGAGL